MQHSLISEELQQPLFLLLLPKLDAYALGCLASSCRSMRQLVNSAPPSIWTAAAAAILPQPLVTCSSKHQAQALLMRYKTACRNLRTGTTVGLAQFVDYDGAEPKYSPCGSMFARLALGSDSTDCYRVQIFRVASDTVTEVLLPAAPAFIWQEVAWSPDGGSIFIVGMHSSGADHHVLLQTVDPVTLQATCCKEFAIPFAAAHCSAQLQISEGSQFLVCCVWCTEGGQQHNGHLQVFDLKSGSICLSDELSTFHKHRKPLLTRLPGSGHVMLAAFSAGSAAGKSVLKVWNLSNAKSVRLQACQGYQGPAAEIRGTCVRFDDSEGRGGFFSTSLPGSGRLAHIGSKHQCHFIGGNTYVSLAPNGTKALKSVRAAQMPTSIAICCTSDGRMLCSLKQADKLVHNLERFAWSPDCNFVAACQKTSLLVFSADSGSQLMAMQIAGWSQGLVWAPDMTTLVVQAYRSTFKGTVEILKLAD